MSACHERIRMFSVPFLQTIHNFLDSIDGVPNPLIMFFVLLSHLSSDFLGTVLKSQAWSKRFWYCEKFEVSNRTKSWSACGIFCTERVVVLKGSSTVGFDFKKIEPISLPHHILCMWKHFLPMFLHCYHCFLFALLLSVSVFFNKMGDRLLYISGSSM